MNERIADAVRGRGPRQAQVIQMPAAKAAAFRSSAEGARRPAEPAEEE
jgi:hypothetical protein